MGHAGTRTRTMHGDDTDASDTYVTPPIAKEEDLLGKSRTTSLTTATCHVYLYLHVSGVLAPDVNDTPLMTHLYPAPPPVDIAGVWWVKRGSASRPRIRTAFSHSDNRHPFFFSHRSVFT